MMNLKSPEVQVNPFPFYKGLLEKNICRVDPGNIWAIASYDNVRYALKHHERFSSSGFGAMLQPEWLIGTLVSELTGIGQGEIPEFLLTCAKLIEIMPVTMPEQEYIDRLEAAVSQQNAFFEQLIQDKKTNPKKDLMSLLVKSANNNKLMSHSLLLQAMALFVSAGYQTPVHMLSNAIVQLSTHPEITQLLVVAPDKIPLFIEESMRLSPNSHGFLRKTTEEVTLSGITIPKNSTAYLIAAAANRDPAHFVHPDEFDIYRENIKTHLSFGFGIHLCVGAALARAQIKVALEVILSRFGSVHCLPGYEQETIDSFIV